MTSRDVRKRARESPITSTGIGSQKRRRRPLHRSDQQDVEIQIYAIAKKNWIPPATISRSEESYSPETASVVSDIYRSYLCSETTNTALAALVESEYFEYLLWPTYRRSVKTTENSDDTSDQVHNMMSSVMALFVYVRRQKPELAEKILTYFDQDRPAFTKLCHSLFKESTHSRSVQERSLRTSFLTEMFRLTDHSCAREVLGPFVSISIWVHLSRRALKEQAENYPAFRKQIKRLARRMRERDSRIISLQETGLFRLLTELESEVALLAKAPSESSLHVAGGLLTLFADLLSQPRIRIFVLPLLEDRSTLPYVQGLTFALAEKPSSFSKTAWSVWNDKVGWFTHYVTFPHDTSTGETIARDLLREKNSSLLLKVQSTVYAASKRRGLLPDHPISFIPQATQRTLRSGSILRSAFMRCEDDVLQDIRESLSLSDSIKLKQSDSADNLSTDDANKISSRRLAIGAMAYLCVTAEDGLEKFRNSPMMINEGDFSATEHQSTSILGSTRLPCLNNEFLNIQDYLLRNFLLCKAEVATAVRKNLETAIVQMQPSWNGNNYDFAGQSSLALPIDSCEAAKTEFKMSSLVSSMNTKVLFRINFSRCSSRVRREWEDLSGEDVMFLVKLGTLGEYKENVEKTLDCHDLATLVSNSSVRGVLVKTLKAEMKNMKNSVSHGGMATGFLDSIQFALDSQGVQDTERNTIHDFDLIGRSPCEQKVLLSFLSLLRESLLKEEPCLPRWLEDSLIGRGTSPDVEQGDDAVDGESLNFADTFLTEEHLKSSFPGAEVTIVKHPVDASLGCTLYHLRFHGTDSASKVEAEAYSDSAGSFNGLFQIGSNSYERPTNVTRFNPSQIAAIRSGMKKGITLLEGPPGTGKTSCIVQMATNLFHTVANERVLITTRSEQSLNQVLRRILGTNIDPLRVVKMAVGAPADSFESMSPDGRVNALLQRRLHLLSEVSRLAACCGEAGHFVPSEDWNCELADNYYQTVVRVRWQSFMETKDQSWDQFPFRTFFSGNRKQISETDGVTVTHGGEQTDDPLMCYSAIASLFAEVEELRFLEVLRHGRQRVSYVLTTYSRVVAMTGSYAASHRRNLVAQEFSYDTVIVEEATASLETETLICMLLQKHPMHGQAHRLKRVVLTGDQRQVPQVQNDELRNVCNLRQSMFHRLLRLDSNVIRLTCQGRARKSIADLMRLQYPSLKDMSYIALGKRFTRANPGFAYTSQFIDTGDERSEREVALNSFQNIVEAEFIAFLYIYMRLLGYPAAKIAVLTMYDSQVVLLKDVIKSRLAEFPQVKGTCSISRVDDRQVHVADYILVSLVRTSSPENYSQKASDYQRITSALSKACLGVYIFGSLPRYETIADFKRLMEILPPSRLLTLVATETFTDCDRSEGDNAHEKLPTREVHSPADMAAIVSHLYSAITSSS